jgi:hypothetical protein
MIKKYRKNKSDPSPFSYFDPPTHHGGHRFFFVGGPLAGGPLEWDSWGYNAARARCSEAAPR